MFTPDIVAVHLSLIICTIVYAAALNIPAVHNKYTPDGVIWTVVGGVMIVGLHFGALCWLAVLPWLAFVYLVSLFLAAGFIIWIWQQQQTKQRRQEQMQREHADGGHK